GPVLPAFPQYPDPFEGQCTQDDMPRFAFSLHGFIVGPGPSRIDDRLPGPLHKCLSDENRRTPTPMSPELLAAFLPYWSHPGEFLQRRRLRVKRSYRAKGYTQTWRQMRASPGQITKERGLGMLPKECFDLHFDDRDVFAEGLQLIQQQAQVQDGRFDPAMIGGQCHRVADQLQPLLQQFRPTQVMGVIEASDSAGFSCFQSQHV